VAVNFDFTQRSKGAKKISRSGRGGKLSLLLCVLCMKFLKLQSTVCIFPANKKRKSPFSRAKQPDSVLAPKPLDSNPILQETNIMKKIIGSFLLILWGGLASYSQGSVSIKKVLDGKVCDSCDVEGSFAYSEYLNFAILGAPEEYVTRNDREYMATARKLKNFSGHLIGSSSFTIDFLPVTKADPTKIRPGLTGRVTGIGTDYTVLPDLPYEPGLSKKQIGFDELEFQIVRDDSSIVQDWKSITELPQEKAYSFRCGDKPETQSACAAYQAGRFTFGVDDNMLIRIRKRNTEEVLRNIYIKRPKIAPDIESVSVIPAGTTLQDVLNKETGNEHVWPTTNDVIEIEPGNSVSLGFSKGMNGRRIIEYAFASDPDNWHMLVNKRASDMLDPFYLVIENPKPGSTVEVLIRYANQRETVKHIKIIVKPKRTQTTAFVIAASLVLAFLLFMIGYYVNRRKSKRQFRQLMIKKKDLENKLQLLSGQFNPHFLFNSLNSIQHLVNKSDAENASDYIARVSSFLRRVMDAGKKEFISLQEELEIAESYLQLEQKKKPFTYTINNACDTALSETDFTPLLLQPVLENSIHHGFTKEIIDPALVISIACTDKELRVSIADNGKGFDPASAKKGHGLELVEKRIALMNEKPGNHIKMEISSATGKGTITTFTFNNWL
jgi:hypothetical protein